MDRFIYCHDIAGMPDWYFGPDTDCPDTGMREGTLAHNGLCMGCGMPGHGRVSE